MFAVYMPFPRIVVRGRFRGQRPILRLCISQLRTVCSELMCINKTCTLVRDTWFYIYIGLRYNNKLDDRFKCV